MLDVLLCCSDRAVIPERASFGTSFSSTPSCQLPYQTLESSDVLYIKAKARFQTWQHRGTLGNEADLHTGNTARCAHKQCNYCISWCRDTSELGTRISPTWCQLSYRICVFMSHHDTTDNEDNVAFSRFFGQLHNTKSEVFFVFFVFAYLHIIHTVSSYVWIIISAESVRELWACHHPCSRNRLTFREISLCAVLLRLRKPKPLS